MYHGYTSTSSMCHCGYTTSLVDQVSDTWLYLNREEEIAMNDTIIIVVATLASIAAIACIVWLCMS